VLETAYTPIAADVEMESMGLYPRSTATSPAKSKPAFAAPNFTVTTPSVFNPANQGTGFVTTSGFASQQKATPDFNSFSKGTKQ